MITATVTATVTSTSVLSVFSCTATGTGMNVIEAPGACGRPPGVLRGDIRSCHLDVFTDFVPVAFLSFEFSGTETRTACDHEPVIVPYTGNLFALLEGTPSVTNGVVTAIDFNRTRTDDNKVTVTTGIVKIAAATPTSGPTSTPTLTHTPTGTPTPSPTSTSAIGARRFSAHFGSALDETGESIAINSAGTVLLGGSIQSIVDFGTGPVMPSGGDDAVVVKFDSNGTALWTKVYGDASSQTITDVAFDSLGNVLITGQFEGSIDFGGGPLTSAGGNDIFVAKLDANGNHLWSKRFGDASTQTGGKIAIDRSNNVLIAGNFEGAVDFGGGPLTSAGGIDICLAKLDLNGDHVFSKRFGSAGDQLCGDLAVDGADNIYLTGGFSGSVNFGGGILTSAGLNDVYLAKLDVAGTHVFSTRYGNASDQTSSGIAVNSTGVAITGTFDGSIDFGGGLLTSAGSTDVFVAQFSTAGAHIWSGGFGNSGTQQSGGICNDTLGGVWVTGRFGGTIDFGGGVLTSAGAEDVYIARLTSSGAHRSSQGFGDASTQNGLAVAATVTGDPWITGEFAGTIDFGGGPLTSSGGFDIYLAELNP